MDSRIVEENALGFDFLILNVFDDGYDYDYDYDYACYFDCHCDYDFDYNDQRIESLSKKAWCSLTTRMNYFNYGKVDHYYHSRLCNITSSDVTLAEPNPLPSIKLIPAYIYMITVSSVSCLLNTTTSTSQHLPCQLICQPSGRIARDYAQFQLSLKKYYDVISSLPHSVSPVLDDYCRTDSNYDASIIRPSIRSWALPLHMLHMVLKEQRITWRHCGDSRRPNNVTKA
ncbi:hypothetical protein T10_5454 [Trichinella papuae]|uniref:Uncharacterized protein n=1 Tax=Trichinella papuae TaxID=268474 RepID=A0A0V1MAI6_9BILA|nr:hypothetical protein T10_5454 [Trichinella papuae]